LVGLVALGGLLVACGGTAAPTSGVLTGVATPCAGALTLDHYADFPVRVTITQGSQTVASKTVRETHTFRFLVPRGRYLVSSDQSGVAPVTVTVQTGGTDHVNLLANCM
jgi:hypothetical protein